MSRVYDFGEPLPARPGRLQVRNHLDALRPRVGALWSMGPDLPAILSDLLDVAMAVYVVDRLERRSQKKSDWKARSLTLRVPVSDPQRWRRLAPELVRLLHWLTTDAWDVQFTDRVTSRRARPAGGLCSPAVQRPFVGLYSGGLDSLAGAVADALNPAYGSAVLVGGQSGRLKALQVRQHAALQERLSHLHWEPFRGYSHDCKQGALADWAISEQAQEKSQRSRAFLFLTFGAVTAYVYGVPELRVYENGIGAINLPYSDAFGGADQTRAMHPRTLLLAGRLFSEVFDQLFRIVNASLWRTKGEMCVEVARAGLGPLVNLTVSCDSYPLRERKKQCGSCTSCLLRRLSLYVAGLGTLDAAGQLYRDDVSLPDGERQRWRPLEFMRMQANVLRELTAPGRWLDFQLAYPDILDAQVAIQESEGCSLDEVTAGLQRLYRQYAWEFDQFDRAGRSPLITLQRLSA